MARRRTRPVYRIEMLPARQGDALWVEYGDARQPARLLVDVGVGATSRVVAARARKLPAGERRLELLAVTHVDTDHIGGALKLVADTGLGLECERVWFNGWEQIARVLGPIDGDILSVLIGRRGWPLNPEFDGRAVVVEDGGDLPRVELPGGMVLTLLSPGTAELQALRGVWEEVTTEAGIAPGQEGEALRRAARRRGVILGETVPDVEALAATRSTVDRAEANGSTIAFLAEHGGRSCLFGGDAHPDRLVASLERLLRERGLTRLPLSALKVPHHGSEHNVTDRLLRLVDCERFLFSSDGTQTGHPHPEAVARVLLSLEHPAALVFNYETELNRAWKSERLQRRYGYTAVYPPAGTAGIAVEL